MRTPTPHVGRRERDAGTDDPVGRRERDADTDDASWDVANEKRTSTTYSGAARWFEDTRRASRNEMRISTTPVGRREREPDTDAPRGTSRTRCGHRRPRGASRTRCGHRRPRGASRTRAGHRRPVGRREREANIDDPRRRGSMVRGHTAGVAERDADIDDPRGASRTRAGHRRVG